MRLLPLLSLLACSGDKSGTLDPAVDSEALFAGPFVYDTVGQDGALLIDTLWIVSAQAVDEIAALGETPEGYLDWRIDAMNDTLSRSLIDSSVVRSLGVHVLQDADFERVQQDLGDTSINISYALSWLGTYRETYGADKVMIVAGTAEGASGAALGGGDVSAHWVTFLPVEHEFGHQMGGSHCNDGQAGVLNFGYPASGYTTDGFPVEGGPVSAGTRMCGNSIAIYSNPDLRLTLDEIDDLVAQDLMPAGDWAALAESDGRVPMGDPEYANMAAQWRSAETDAAERMPVTLYDGEAGAPYDVEGCVALYAHEGYGGFREELCVGDEATGLEDISSIQVGRNVHVSLYTDPDFGAGSMCGGQLQRLAYSSPSLESLSVHHGVPSLDDAVRSISVYAPTDRVAHERREGLYRFYGSGAAPSCEGAEGNELVVMPDGLAWSATAAVYTEPVPVPFAVDFMLTSSHAGETPPADALTFFFAKAADSYTVAPPTREQQGVAVDGTGYAVEINTWLGIAGLRDSAWGTIGSDVSHNSFTDGVAVPVRIEVHRDEIVVMWDGDELLRADVDVDTTHETVGFSAATGAYTIEYRLTDITYTAL